VDGPVSQRAASPSDVTFRVPTAGDHPALVARVDDWWGGRRMRARFPHAWFEHFTATSRLAIDPTGQVVGFAVAYVSPDRPDVGVVHLIGVDPNRRRRGIGRALVEEVGQELRQRGVRRIQAAVWPGDPIAVAFHRGVGFAVDDGPGTANVYGTPGYLDHDGEGEDRAIFWLTLS
jgi:ribosomal protein S18 acetylase RimI-like enzyme